MLKENLLKFREDIQLISFKLNFITENEADVPLRNHSMMQGAIFNIFAQTNPIFSYKHHKKTKVRPWSFSLLKFDDPPEKIEKSGFSRIYQGIEGYFSLKTIDPETSNIIMQFCKTGQLIKLGKLLLNINDIKIEYRDLSKAPETINTITLKLETPTYFYSKSENIQEDLSGETLLKYQCEKFKQLDIINLEPKLLYPYMWLLNKDTHESWGFITSSYDKSNAVPFKGIIGLITFKVVGTPSERTLIWKILQISEYTGIGTRTSMGFGHNSLISVK